eukprot:4592358-Prymnesium_polylepis.1
MPAPQSAPPMPTPAPAAPHAPASICHLVRLAHGPPERGSPAAPGGSTNGLPRAPAAPTTSRDPRFSTS